MNRIAFISDIHGNYSALKSVWNDIQRRNISTIYCLGDLVGYYCQINEVIDFIRAKGIPTIMGNHDYAMAYKSGVIDRSKTCTNVLKWQLENIRSENFEFLKRLSKSFEITIDNSTICGIHGGTKDEIDQYLTDEDIDALLESGYEPYSHLITGHSHIPIIKSSLKLKYCNCGSVGQPRDHNPDASYAIYEDGEFYIIRVSYDIKETIDAMKENNFPDYISEVLQKGCRIGG